MDQDTLNRPGSPWANEPRASVPSTAAAVRNDLLQIAVIALLLLSVILGGAAFSFFSLWKQAIARTNIAETERLQADKAIKQLEFQLRTATASTTPGVMGPSGMPGLPPADFKALLSDPQATLLMEEVLRHNPDLRKMIPGGDAETALKIGVTLLDAYDRAQSLSTPPSPPGVRPVAPMP